MRCVFGSNVMVRAPRSVWTVSTVLHFPPMFFTIVSVPSPFELKQDRCRGHIPRRQDLRDSRCRENLKSFHIGNDHHLLSQTENSTPSLASMARPDGSTQGEMEPVRSTAGLVASIYVMAPLSSRLT